MDGFMPKPSVTFDRGDAAWIPERESIGFPGMTDFGPVEFLITKDALSYLLSPDLDEIDSETALETFFAFESVIHRVARREFVKRLGGEPPILLTVSDVEDAKLPARTPNENEESNDID
jgi:hypothetical protein